MKLFTKYEHGDPLELLFQERERIARLSQIREIIFGAQDGLLVPLGVVSSVAGAFLNNHFVLVAGIAEGLAGAFSMATGAYLSSQAEGEVYKTEINKELAEIKKDFEHEKTELVALFQREGLSHEDAQIAVNVIGKSERSFSDTMIQKELGISPEAESTEISDAMYVGFSYLLNSAIPLLPYFFLPALKALPVSIILTLLALFGLGLLKAKFASLNYLKAGLQVMMVGAFSGLGGYLIGTVLPNLLHISK